MDQRIKILFFLMLVCAIALSIAAHFFAVFPFDPEITRELQEIRNPAFAFTMQAVSALGDTWIGIGMTGAVAIFFLGKHRLTDACFILATLSNFVLTSYIKVVVARPRPPDFSLNPADIFLPVNQYSFPSGHVLFFIVFFGFVAYLAWLQLTGYVRIIIVAACGTLILLIGPSRVYLGAHWASDVLGSYVIGILWLILLILGYQLVAYVRIRGKGT